MLGDTNINYEARRRNDNLTLKELTKNLGRKARIKWLIIIYYHQAIEFISKLFMILSLLISFYYAVLNFDCFRALTSMFLALTSSLVYRITPKVK